MELIITMVIIGVLTAIAIPNYTAYIQRSNRAEARNALLEAATWMERWRTERGLYGNAPGTPTTAPVAFPFTQVPRTGTAKYTIAAPTIAALGIGYSITATAVGVMATDVCSTLTITETGARNFTTGGGGTQEICWNR
jgi:type IV pilus assembly protein PilE